MGELLQRITIEAGKMGGRPHFRGLRIRMQDILASEMTAAEILTEFPRLQADDSRASLAYAAAQAAGTAIIAA